jgi:phage shock protein A
LQRSLQEAIGRGNELEGYIAALLAKKREMESGLQDYICARAAADVPSIASSSSGVTQDKVERAGSAFDRVLAQQTGIAGVTSAVDADASKLRELQELARKHRIDERLAALKAAQANSR